MNCLAYSSFGKPISARIYIYLHPVDCTFHLTKKLFPPLQVSLLALINTISVFDVQLLLLEGLVEVCAYGHDCQMPSSSGTHRYMWDRRA